MQVLRGTNNTLALNNPDPGSPLRYYEPDCVWSLGYQTGLALNQYLSSIVDSAYLDEYIENTFKTTGLAFLKSMYRNGTATLGSTNKYMLRVTGTLTDAMRQRGDGGPSQWAVGNVLESRTCVGVKWAWISLPALIILLSNAFVAFVASHSSRARVWTGAWRSSAVAPILAGLNSDVSYIAAGAGRRSDVDRTAKRLRVKVSMEEGRLEVIERPPLPEQQNRTDQSEATGEKA